MLTRRHFSLIQIFFSYQVRRGKKKGLCEIGKDDLKVLHGPAFTTSNRENTTFLN